jgi:hypothetical protein
MATGSNIPSLAVEYWLNGSGRNAEGVVLVSRALHAHDERTD